jgi:hypothetical protein
MDDEIKVIGAMSGNAMVAIDFVAKALPKHIEGMQYQDVHTFDLAGFKSPSSRDLKDHQENDSFLTENIFGKQFKS